MSDEELERYKIRVLCVKKQSDVDEELKKFEKDLKEKCREHDIKILADNIEITTSSFSLGVSVVIEFRIETTEETRKKFIKYLGKIGYPAKVFPF